MKIQLALGMVFFAWLSGTVSLVLLSLYKKRKGSHLFIRNHWARYWVFSIEEVGGFRIATLILVSVLGLFLELMLIRWVSSEIRIFAYFKNFVLIACFLGFGLGSHLCRRQINLLPLIVSPVTIALLIKLPWKPLRDFISAVPNLLGSASDVQIWGVPSVPAAGASITMLLIAGAMIAPLFVLLTLAFVPIGQIVGWHMENAPNGIWAYSVNILASLGGILLYTLLCFQYQPPPIWFAVAGAIAIALFWKQPILRWSVLTAFGLSAGLALLNPDPAATDYWSPYQKLSLKSEQQAGETLAYSIYTNDSWHQRMLNLSPAFVTRHPQFYGGIPSELNAYNLPYRFRPNPPAVLVLGAGTGNDLAAALRNGSGRVVAVEIDPLILELGRQLHFEKPYDSPRVEAILEDARSYIQNSTDRFDLIVFSLLDSHTTSSHYTNIRIDNYVYTLEALRAAQRLLLPDGAFIIKFQVATPWIAGRLRELMTKVFGRPPFEMHAYNSPDSVESFFIEAGEGRVREALSDASFAAQAKSQRSLKIQDATLTTDDWPYFYQHEPGVPASVIAISIAVFLLSWWAMAETGVSIGALRWHFFFLGAGFLLLEVQIISRMALLFGTTWLINSIVISALLLILVASNVLVKQFPQIPLRLAYIGLFVCLSISYLVPTSVLFFASPWLKGCVAAMVLCLPVFFAGIIFIQSFSQAGFSGEALGSNLMGSLVGGLLESLSYWTGLRSLLLLTIFLYLSSLLTLHRCQRTEDRNTGQIM